MAGEFKNRFEDLTHLFHEKYRASGIALCLSLAALAVSESWWFYSFHKDILQTESLLQKLAYYFVVIAALFVILLSFYVQYQHYQGMKHMARSYYHAYKEVETKESAENSKMERVEKDKEWEKGKIFLSSADCGVKCLVWTALVNFIAALFYIILFTPDLP